MAPPKLQGIEVAVVLEMYLLKFQILIKTRTIKLKPQSFAFVNTPSLEFVICTHSSHHRGNSLYLQLSKSKWFTKYKTYPSILSNPCFLCSGHIHNNSSFSHLCHASFDFESSCWEKKLNKYFLFTEKGKKRTWSLSKGWSGVALPITCLATTKKTKRNFKVNCANSCWLSLFGEQIDACFQSHVTCCLYPLKDLIHLGYN